MLVILWRCWLFRKISAFLSLPFSPFFILLPSSFILLFLSFLHIQTRACVNRCGGWARRGSERRGKQIYSLGSVFFIPEQYFLPNKLRTTWYGAKTWRLRVKRFLFPVLPPSSCKALTKSWSYCISWFLIATSVIIIYLREWFPWSPQNVQRSGVNNGILVLLRVLGHGVLILHSIQEERQLSFLVSYR